MQQIFKFVTLSPMWYHVIIQSMCNDIIRILLPTYRRMSVFYSVKMLLIVKSKIGVKFLSQLFLHVYACFLL
jgi:hypothetical protein